MKRGWTGLCCFLLAIGFWAPEVFAQEKVQVALDWVIQGRHTPYFAAKAKGFWKEAGLDVEISRGFGAGDTAKRVAAGTADFGMADPSAIIVARANTDAKVKIVAILYGKAPFAIVAFKGKGVRGPKDLMGKTLGAPEGDATRIVFPAFAAQVGIDLAQVRWVTMEATAKTPSLLAGRVDAITHFVFEKLLFADLTRQHGEFDFWLLADYGFDIYSNSMTVGDALLEGKPRGARAFLAGLIKGYEFTFAQPDEAHRLFISQHAIGAPALARAELEVVKELVLTEEAKRHGVGWMSREKMERTRNVMCQAYKCKRVPALEEIATTDFLPRR